MVELGLVVNKEFPKEKVIELGTKKKLDQRGGKNSILDRGNSMYKCLLAEIGRLQKLELKKLGEPGARPGRDYGPQKGYLFILRAKLGVCFETLTLAAVCSGEGEFERSSRDTNGQLLQWSRSKMIA